MRSAGCIFNDIVDRDIDRKVYRTKSRPIPSGRINLATCFFYVIFICLIALLILIQFNLFTILLGLGSMFLAFAYPFMKRITYWPQLFLGITFNWGVLMAWSAINNDLSYQIVILYIAAIFWTLGYDTIYGVQDLVDDEIIGMKSTSIKFKNNIKLFVSFCYFISSILIAYLFYDKIGFNNFTLFFLIFILSLMYQIIIFKKNKPEKCLQAFRLNNFSGLILFWGILI
tara:strand:+ start:45 stop:728 length:684 start_codon:yes stop_codon:yes gene_type:complete